MTLTQFTIDIFDNFHSNVSIVRTTDRTYTQHVSNRCLIIRASNSRKILCRGLFDDIRTTMDLIEDPNQMILHIMISVMAYVFLLANPYRHLNREFCTKNKTWNIREFRERDGRC